jgi:thymidine kinase
MSKTRESITGFVGPMFAKKTLLMLHEISAAEATGRYALIFKPNIDNRYPKNIVRSRAGGKHPAIPIPFDHPEIIYKILSRRRLPVDIVAFDEIQFFDPYVVEIVKTLAQSGILIVFCGLNRNYRGDAFPTMEKILPLATDLIVVEAKCMYAKNGQKPCGADATMTQRLVNGKPDSYRSPTVIIENPGTAVTYQARCLEHWKVKHLPNRKIPKL